MRFPENIRRRWAGGLLIASILAITASAGALYFGMAIGLGGGGYREVPAANLLIKIAANLAILSPIASLASAGLILKICFDQKRLIWWAIPAVVLSLMWIGLCIWLSMIYFA